MSFVKGFVKQLNNGIYNENTRHYLRQVNSDLPEDATEILNELETSDEPSNEPIETTTDTVQSTFDNSWTESGLTSDLYNPPTVAVGGDAEASSETSQTVLIVLGLLLAILVIVCCVLACIFARIRRKGFCTVDGRNQPTCDEDCEQDAMSMQQSPKDSLSSGKSANCRSSDKLLTK